MKKARRVAQKVLDHPMLFWVLVAVVFAVARVATWGYPYDSDHWIFYYVGKDWVENGSLYVTAWDHKPPLIFLFNAFMYIIAGDSIVLHRIWLTGVAVITIILFYAFTKQVMPQLLTAMGRHATAIKTQRLVRVTTLLFVFLASLSQFASSGNNTENYGVLFLIGMWLAYSYFTKRQQWRYLLVAGICLSALFFLKGTFVLFGAPLAVLLFLQYRKNVSKLFAAFAIVTIPLVAQGVYWVWYFMQQGTFNEFVVASFSFSAKYATSAWRGAVSNEPLLAVVFFATLLPAIAAFVVFLRDYKRARHNTAYLGLGLSFVIGLLIVLSVGSFYPYYLQIIMPLLVLMLAYAYIRIASSRLRLRYGAVVAMVVLLVVLYGVSLKQLINNYTGVAYQSAKENTEVARYIQRHTTPQDRIFDDEYGATMYQLAERKSGSRYVSASVLLLDYRDNYGFGLDGIFIKDMENSQAVYVVTPIGKSLYDSNRPVANYIRTHYHLEKAFTTMEVLRRN